eukprot:11934-Heterococcus_DN1.PRE.1
MQKCYGDVYRDMDLTMDCWPEDGKTDPKAYLTAIDAFDAGDACTIFTPDDTHFAIALAAVQRGLHTMVTKPVVKTLDEHRQLYEAAKKAGVLVMVEVHKRFDPIYVDAKDRIEALGNFSYMYAYMSQPKHQLDTFRAWAGKGSDISIAVGALHPMCRCQQCFAVCVTSISCANERQQLVQNTAVQVKRYALTVVQSFRSVHANSYYLNSHHVDFQEWAMQGKARPVRVTATASTGVAHAKDIPTEDAITLMVQWQ